jgi:hypothetical protein
MRGGVTRPGVRLLAPVLGMLVSAGSSVLAQPGPQCTLAVTSRVTLDTDAATLSGMPMVVSANRAGALIVVESNKAVPAVFRGTGEFVGRLGREGRGPGELSMASWADGEIDEYLRVVDVDRIVVFDRALRPQKTVVAAYGRTPISVWTAAVLRPDAYVAQSSEQDTRDPTRTVPLVVRSDSGRVLAEIQIPKIDGQKTLVKVARKLGDPRAFWLSETIVKSMSGYRVTAMSEAGVRQAAFPQQRGWWITADFDREPVAALSRVRFLRQMDAVRLAVMITQPRKDWRSVPVSRSDFSRDKERYETVIEVLDVRTGELLGCAAMAGFPISLLPERRAAVYLEDGDGNPRIDIVEFALPAVRQ